MKFSIGDKVVEKSDCRAFSSYPVWEVVSFLQDDVLIVFWGDGFNGELHPTEWPDEPGKRSWHESIHRFQESELLSLDEALNEIHRLEAVNNKLEEEFNSLRDQIQEKLAQAASLVEEVNALAAARNKDLCNLKDECKPLHKALEAGGWRSSYMRC